MRHNSLDLDVDAPGCVAEALYAAAEQYRESTSELQSAWQDPNIIVWDKLANALEACARKCGKLVTRYT